MSKETTSYCDENGKYQADYSRLYDENVPASGESETIEGELIRAISRLFYEYCNNGNCNAAKREVEEQEETCWECDGDGDGYFMEETYSELEIDDFYDDFLTLIEKNVPSSSSQVQGVRELICHETLHYNYKYSQEEMDVYNNLCDKVIEYVLEKEKTGFTNSKSGEIVDCNIITQRKIISKEYDRLFDLLVPSINDTCDTIEGELLKAVNVLICDYYSGDYYFKEISDKNVELDPFYIKVFNLFINLIPNTLESVDTLKELICDKTLQCKFKYNQHEADIYNNLSDKVIEYVLEKEKTGFTKNV